MTFLIWVVAGFLIGSGCASHPSGGKADEDSKIFTLDLTSDPPVAKLRTAPDAEVWDRIKTPGQLTFRLTRKTSGDFLGKLGLDSWQPETELFQPWAVTETKDSFIFDTQELLMVKEGYEAQPFSYQWEVPKDFQNRDAEGKKTGEISYHRKLTVVFQNPIRPHFTREIQLRSRSGPISLYAVNANGQPGEKIAVTPLSSTLSVAAVRSPDGEIKDWKVWDNEGLNLWTISKDGLVMLNAFLVCENYKPEKITNYVMFKLALEQKSSIQVTLQMTTPTVPETDFILELDTLPSGAGVYVLNDDNTLGQKLGDLPAQLKVGLAQQVERLPGGVYQHKDWMLWDPTGLFKIWSDAQGNAQIVLSCTLFLEGFSPENIIKPVLDLIPGKPFVQKRVLNVPLLKPEQAAVRDKNRLQGLGVNRKMDAQPTPRPTFIWKAPE